MKKEITIRSSAAEYLTYITSNGENDINAIYAVGYKVNFA